MIYVPGDTAVNLALNPMAQVGGSAIH